MQSNSPGAFLLSLTLHAVVVALIFLFGIVLHEKVKETPKIMDLVAGPGDDYAATEAPSASSNEVVTLNMPERPAPVIQPDPAPVITEAPPETIPEIVVKTAPKPVVKPVTKPVEKPKPKPKEVEKPKTKTMSKAEFDRLHANKNNATSKAPTPKAISVKSIDTSGFSSASKSTKGAGGKAMTRAEGALLDAYIALLIQRLHDAHDKPAGLSDLLKARVKFHIAANGAISSVQIVTSSGSAEFDRSVLEAFARMRSIGPTPDGKSDDWTVTFRMREES